MSESPQKKRSPFLRENFAPVHEELDTQELEIHGELPAGLEGAYLRNGPNPKFDPGDEYHWFEGDGMIHAVRLEGGKASFRNRWVQGRALAEEEAAGKSLWTGGFLMGHDREPVKNSSNTHIIPAAGRALSLQEGGAPYEIDPVTLETKGLIDFEGELRQTFTAHPKVDPINGELVYFGWFTFHKRIDYGVVDAGGKLVHKTSFKLPVTTMMHDFCITENYAIFFDMPLKYRLEKIAKDGVPFSWEEENGTRIGVLPRRAEASEMRWYELPPFYLFHVGNAYEDGNDVVFTAARQRRTTFAGAIAVDRSDGDDVNSPRMHEWRLDLETGACSERQLDPVGCEFPVVSPKVVGQHSRYIYAGHEVSSRGIGSAMYTGAYKLDQEAGDITEHLWGEGCFGGENVFVPRPGSSDEDDGWLLGYVYDSSKDASQLRILDARDLRAGELACVDLPQRVPYGFHGSWFPSESSS